MTIIIKLFVIVEEREGNGSEKIIAIMDKNGMKCAKRHVLLILFIAKVTQCGFSIKNSGALATDSAGKLHVLGHDGDSLGVDGAQHSVLKQVHQEGFRSFLKTFQSQDLELQRLSLLFPNHL